MKLKDLRHRKDKMKLVIKKRGETKTIQNKIKKEQKFATTLGVPVVAHRLRT